MLGVERSFSGRDDFIRQSQVKVMTEVIFEVIYWKRLLSAVVVVSITPMVAGGAGRDWVTR